VRYVPGDADHPPRVAYAVGRRSGSAVERNRIRRRLRAAVDRSADDLAAGAYLLEADRVVLTCPFADLCEAVATAAAQAASEVSR
jgi:ribonuclease P protein component